MPSERAEADQAPTRDMMRSRRKRAVRARSISIRRMPKYELEVGRQLYPEADDPPARPTTRGECSSVPRPCPFVSRREAPDGQ